MLYVMSAMVRDTIKKVGGTMPEDLPTPKKSLKELTKEKQLPTPSMPAGVIKVQLNDETYKKDCIIEKGKLLGEYDLKQLKENGESLEEIFMAVTGNSVGVK